MATLSQAISETANVADDPADQIAMLLEEHFNEMGWSEDERNQRVARASEVIDDAVAHARHP